MKTFTNCVIGCLVAVGASNAYAQVAQAPSATGGTRPPVEMGAGVSLAGAIGEEAGAVPLVDGRLGLRLTRRFGIEGLVHVWPGSRADNLGGVYRTQVIYRPNTANGHVFAGLGLAGVFDWERWSESRWTDSDGRTHVYPGGRDFDISLPVVPTLSVGYERVLMSRLALRVELTAAVIPDDETSVIVLPAISMSVPLGGRYASRRPTPNQ